MKMTKFTCISIIGIILFHTQAFAIQEKNSWPNTSKNAPFQPTKTDNLTSGLDFTSVTTSVVAGYLNEETSGHYWPDAAVAIAVSAGLQYTVNTQLESVSDLKVAPYFSGTETGIAISFTFQ